MRTKATTELCKESVTIAGGRKVRCGGRLVEITTDEDGLDVTDRVCLRYGYHKKRIAREKLVKTSLGFQKVALG